MIRHSELGPKSFATARKLKAMVYQDLVRLAGNQNLKIYGRLSCGSGKRMKFENRIFFKSEEEALANGYRPCGHCMREEYRRWKSN